MAVEVDGRHVPVGDGAVDAHVHERRFRSRAGGAGVALLAGLPAVAGAPPGVEP